jgi:PhnB protein
MDTPGGEVAHAELEIGGRIVMLADRLPIYPWRPPNELGGTSVGIGMYVEDVDAAVRRAVEAGARVTLPVAESSTASPGSRCPSRTSSTAIAEPADRVEVG